MRLYFNDVKVNWALRLSVFKAFLYDSANSVLLTEVNKFRSKKRGQNVIYAHIDGKVP